MSVQERRNYYWLVARDSQTNQTTLIFGSDKSESEARAKGLEMLPGTDFAIKRLPTRDTGRASQMLKGGKLERMHSLSEATKRLKHKLGKRRRPI